MPWATLALVAALGLTAGSYQIANTSIGWHIASGRWVLDHHAVPRTDPFSFTTDGEEWIDHEWLFQVVVAVAESLGGAPLLVLTRAALVAALALLMFGLAWRSGLSPPAATVLVSLCLYGARIRFFLRPELVTLLLAPVVVWIFLRRDGSRSRWWLAWIGFAMAAGANFHAGILVVPPLLAGLLAADWLQWLRTRDGQSPLPTGALAVAVASAAPLVNPYGWRLYTVPVEIARLVALPHIPNPEWISPSFHDVPPLYVAMVVGTLVLALRERRAVRWALLVMVSALAMRHVRNVGLFFALYPIAVAPALASMPVLAPSGVVARRPLARIAALALAIILVASMTIEPGRRPSLSYSADFFPWRAFAFIQQHGLDTTPTYNDVRFGGWLILRHYPERRVFLDDRNELHEPLLAEIHSDLASSDPTAWQAMLDRYHIEVALLRYNAPFTVLRPDGETVGLRGFSTLWFPAERWALLYWDDTAMVLVDRTKADTALVAANEYQIIRPDDVDELRRQIATDPIARAAIATEVARKLAEQPDCERALALADALLGQVP